MFPPFPNNSDYFEIKDETLTYKLKNNPITLKMSTKNKAEKQLIAAIMIRMWSIVYNRQKEGSPEELLCLKIRSAWCCWADGDAKYLNKELLPLIYHNSVNYKTLK